VTLDAGVVEGTYFGRDSAGAVFKGIPFAAPPTGSLRWKPPQAVARWEGVRSANTYEPVCPQKFYAIDYLDRITKRVGGSAKPQPNPATSEDCLYLNVWTTNTGRRDKQPVMVWIHGGGNVDGWATYGSIDSETLARQGVVVVMIEYRLGALGFLADSALTAESPHHSSGNYGLLDQIAALEWVRRNAAAFGGDPARVTIFGQSAGAANVTCLMLSPLAKGLFHRAIAQSGSCSWPAPELKHPVLGLSPLAPAEQGGRELATRLGLGHDRDVLAAMRAVSADSIVAAAASEPELSHDLIVDGWVIPSQPDLMWARGMIADVPLLIGSNADEMRSLARGFPVRRMQDYPQRLLGVFAGNPILRSLLSRLLAAYPAPDTATAQRRLFEANTDAFGADARWIARALRRAGERDVYLYRFTHVIPSAGGRAMGAFHGAELPFEFGSDPGWPKGVLDDTLGAAIRGYWVNFARAGNPNGSGLPPWPAYDASTEAYVELGDTVRAGEHLRTMQYDVQDSARARLDARLRDAQSVANSAVVR
jgi:para-nitrobenzyl esterase